MQLTGHVASPSSKTQIIIPTRGDGRRQRCCCWTRWRSWQRMRARSTPTARGGAPLAVAQIADKARAPCLLLALIVWNRPAAAASVYFLITQHHLTHL